jgi:exosome complex RNA-binding protein Csl4
MKNYETIQDVVSRLNPEDIVRVKILRAGEQLELSTKKNP